MNGVLLVDGVGRHQNVVNVHLRLLSQLLIALLQIFAQLVHLLHHALNGVLVL